ncbi:hypothetical protein [Streptomyces sp. V1I6]|uniref:hypothetical protein n=1 Tax=Streptomyces sp. V1I6 TaxID=3042273 RepID=UPI00278024DB|nr:hypothetical protein [Streptomyces sp. V1I6]MDQ0845763.1 hypothetical protein [Streptomyces sp. V1I6]
MSSAAAVNRLVVFGDACGSGRMGLDAKRRMRAAMYGAFAEAYASVGVEVDRVHQEDRGDGILAALDPGVPPTLMVGTWLDMLFQSLREHNAGSADRLRLRIGMNAGPVLDDGRGLVGRAVDVAARLCDSPVARRTMELAPGSDLLLVVSDWLYANVVAEGGRYVEPETYRSARVRLKETDETAWFHIPRLPAPPLPEDRPASGPGAAHRSTGGAGEPGAETGGGPVQGDGPPPWDPPGSRTTGTKGTTGSTGTTDRARTAGTAGTTVTHINAQGDVASFENNVFHGEVTGIRKSRGPAAPEGDGAA